MSQQTIRHGATIDVASTKEIAEILAQAMSQQRPDEYRRAKGVINLNAAGAGVSQAADILVPSQYDMLLERVTIGGNGAPSAIVGIFENQVNDVDLLEIIQLGTLGKYSDSFANRILVTANSTVLVNVTGGTANLQVTYNLQARLIEKNHS